MTVGLAALCRGEDGFPRVVIAADRMVTYAGLIEFEHAVPKLTEASSHAVCMAAGDTLVATRLIQDVIGGLVGTSPRIGDIAAQMATQYEQIRNLRLEQDILTPRALSLQAFYGNHQSFNQQLVMVADQVMMQFNLGIELLIAGVDPSGAHIFTVHNPGKLDQQFDVIGHASVGIGQIHTLQSMVGFQHVPDAPFVDTVFRVYASKKRSEVAPGVGVDTDMAVISGAGVQWLTADQLSHLNDVYDHFRQSTSEAVARELATINLQQPATPADEPEAAPQQPLEQETEQ